LALALGTGVEVGYTFRLIDGKQTIDSDSPGLHIDIAHIAYIIGSLRVVESLW
jgi:hypothetical protein